MTTLAEIRTGWNQAARTDAMFYILTLPGKDEGRWDAAEFFAHGRAEIDAAMERLGGLLERTERALDFGCGVGRLTQALADHFDRVDGCDVSPEMVRRAESYSDNDRISFHRNGWRLPFDADTFDLVYSMIVLQHLPQSRQEGYVREFFRVLRPGGVAMFQVPEGPDSGPGSVQSMYGVTRDTVGQWIADAGGTLVGIEDLGQDVSWQNYRYVATA